MIGASSFDLENLLAGTDYFQRCLETFLSTLQPSYYCLNLIVRVLLHGPDGSGKRLLAKAAAKNLNLNFYEERVANLLDENIVGTEKKIKNMIAKLPSTEPCLLYLAGYEIFCKLDETDVDRITYCVKECLDELIDSGISQPLVFVGSSNDFHCVYSKPLFDIFQLDIPMSSPTLVQAEEMIHAITKHTELESESHEYLNQCSNGEYYIGNLLDAIAKAEVLSYKKNLEGERTVKSEDDCDNKLMYTTSWDDIGGLGEVKKEIIDAIQLSIEFPQLKKSGLRRTGILLHGPPGTGKTLLARAVANECSLKFINVKGPELLNEYVGQSEDNVRKLFQRAREASPSVIFFDELDSLAPSRGQAGDSGGVMDRVVSQILAEMDGVGKSEDVFVIGATNRVDLVDSSLLRPGRFDKIIEVPLPNSRKSRIQILMALTRKLKLSDDVDIDKVESMAPENMSGADFQGLCSRALNRAFDRSIKLVEMGEKTEDEVDVITNMDDFLQSFGD